MVEMLLSDEASDAASLYVGKLVRALILRVCLFCGCGVLVISINFLLGFLDRAVTL
jgi:hypothetical protein